MFRVETNGPALPSRAGLYGAGEARCATGASAPIEKCYAGPAVGVVVSGTFDYAARLGRTRAAPGSILFGNAGEPFQCRHLDAGGNRRSVIVLRPDLLAEIANDCGLDDADFAVSAAAPSREAAPLYGAVRRAAAGLRLADEEVIDLAARALTIGRRSRALDATPADRRRILDVVRHLDTAYADPCGLETLSAMSQFSRFHFIRLFRAVTGESPRQYLIGVRLRAAADRLTDTAEPITRIALDIGFNDISHFNITFRRAFGLSPRAWRRSA
ncbi:DNA-binding domain-containing protein, AraC-type [Caulobacter sp. AP07]|uniref:helix-turn-helix domain-containing protein n=1 Tax=Caulobacter sp. AP07 TaxID=1144304 RepID=UPI000271ED6B|nr:AraC family transcriptional regulator [Caulobacter sp. AP07]EJL35825.1 DNA-binding domain-containing protein, AraC-type [Caulobacter sp. AP07]